MTVPGRVSYELLISDSNYSHAKAGVDLPIEPGETPVDALARARAIVLARIRADYRRIGDLRGWIQDDGADDDP